VFRYQDPSNYYYVRLYGSLYLYKVVDGVESVLATATRGTSAPYTLRGKIARDVVNVWVDESQRITDYNITGTTFADAGDLQRGLRRHRCDPCIARGSWESLCVRLLAV
jgi:hypothetical protein